MLNYSMACDSLKRMQVAKFTSCQMLRELILSADELTSKLNF